jgi:hypothetical protein
LNNRRDEGLVMNLEQRELEEILRHNTPESMPNLPCPACGISLREHTSEMIEGMDSQSARRKALIV